MGMFDYVNYTMKCPRCGEEVDGFQSKDGDCCLSTVEPSSIHRFYTSCNNCDLWIEVINKGGGCVCKHCGKQNDNVFEVVVELDEKGGGRFCSTCKNEEKEEDPFICLKCKSGKNRPKWKGGDKNEKRREK